MIVSPRPTSLGRGSLADRLGLTNDEAWAHSLSPNSTDRVPIASRLGPPPRVEMPSSSRIPIMDRLGPLLDEASDFENAQISADLQQKKRKPGRPPGKKKVNSSPLSLPGASSKLRKANQAMAPACKKKLSTVKNAGKTSKTTKGKKTVTKGGIPQDKEDTNSYNLPICNLVPPSTRRRMDFRVQSNPAP